MSGSPTASTTASGTEVVTSDSASEPVAASTISYPESDSARRRTSRRPRSSSTTSNLMVVIVARGPTGRERLLRFPYLTLRALTQNGTEDAVDERGRPRAAEALGGLDRLIDRPLGRDRLVAGEDLRTEHLEQRPPQDRPLHRRDPLQRPVLGVAADELVELGLVLACLLSEGEGEGGDVTGQRVAQGTAEQVALVQRPDRGAALLGSTGHPLADGDELFGHRREDGACRARHDHQVLDPHPELAGQVDAGLDGDDITAGQHRVRALRHARRLVDLQPHAMPQAVPEVLAVARGGDDLARRRVGLAAARPGADGVQSGQLGLADEVVDLQAGVGEVPGGQRAR